MKTRKKGKREGKERERWRKREGGKRDTAQFIRTVSKMHPKVAEMMRLFREQSQGIFYMEVDDIWMGNEKFCHDFLGL